MTTVLIADDHRLVRTCLRLMLSLEQDIVVIGEAEDAASAVELSRRLQPDVVVMDLLDLESQSDSQNMNGFTATQTIVRSEPNTDVILMSFYDHEAMHVMAHEVGAKQLLPKQLVGHQLAQVIRATVNGTHLSPNSSMTSNWVCTTA